MIKIVLMLLFIVHILEAASCAIDRDLIKAIAFDERSLEKGPRYPYVISFNSSSDAAELRGIISSAEIGEWINSRSFDCKTLNNCTELLSVLIENDYKNLDLGHMQFCYRFHVFELSDYFIPQRSEEKACEFLLNLSKQHGWSWKTIGRYHSSNEEKNRKYYESIQKTLKKIKEGKL